MPGWDSLETVTRLHGTTQIVGLILLALGVALAIFAALQLRRGIWPEWLDIGQYQLRSRGFVIAFASVLALLIVAEFAAFGYGLRQKTLTVAAEQAGAERVQRASAEFQKRTAAEAELQRRAEAAELQSRRVAENADQTLKENSELRQKLSAAENKVAELEKTLQKSQAQKRLSEDQKRLLTEALRPFAGQKIQIASIRGDDDAQVLAQDFVSAFDAAGWGDWPPKADGTASHLVDTGQLRRSISSVVVNP